MNIITALKNPNLNKKLKEKSNFNIIGNDIQYQEGIIEMLQKNEKIDLIIISELLPGETEFKELITKIKNINKKIEMIVFFNKENEELKNYLISKGIFNIFINNEITIDELIEIINERNNQKKEIEINEEIKKLKEIILEKENNKKIINNKYLIRLKNITNKLLKNKKNKNKLNIINNKKIISIIGTPGIGKSSFATIFAKLIKNKKILIIDFDILNSSINSIFNVKTYPKKYKGINNLNLNNLIIKINKNINLLCATKILVDEKYRKIKEEFFIQLNKLKNKYDLIIIDNSSECFFEYTREILNKSDLILFMLEPNLIDLKKSKNLLNIYINKWKIKKEKINIIFNKTNKNSITEEVLKTLFSDFNILGKIKINNNYNLIINRNIKLINKKIKKDYLKIIEKLKM